MKKEIKTEDYETVLYKKLKAKDAQEIFTMTLTIILFAALATLILYAIFRDKLTLPIFISIAAAVILVFLLTLSLSRFQRARKKLISEKLLPDMLASKFTLKSYESDSHLSIKEIAEAELMTLWESLEGNDLISGKFQKTEFVFSDITLTRGKEHKNEPYSARLVFKGQWIVCPLAKPLPSECDCEIKLKRIYGAKQEESDVKTEDYSFDSTHIVFTNNKTAAKRLLDKSFRDCLFEIERAARAPIALTIKDGKLHLAVDTGIDLFDADPKTASLEELKARLSKEAEFITSLIAPLSALPYFDN